MAPRAVTILAIGIGALGIVTPPAQAQSTPPSAASEGVADPEIVVTAQRQSQRLRDVPISVTALNAGMLSKAGVNNSLDLQNVTPGLQMVMYGAFLQPAIRGISSTGAGLGDSSNVAFYIDGVYQPSQSGQLTDLPDVQQIEVLKGPQGTLYGQNAAGGAIIINSLRPSFTWTGKIAASYASYDDKQVRGYVSGPIAPALAFSVSGGWRDRHGYRRDVARGTRGLGLDSQVVRGKLLLEASDALSITASGYYSRRIDGDAYAGQPYSGPGASTPLAYALSTVTGVGLPRATSLGDTATSLATQADIRTYGFTLKSELTTKDVAITLINAYGNVKVRNIADLDYTAANIANTITSVDQRDWLSELNLRTLGDGPFKLSAGLFYLNNREAYVPSAVVLRYASGAPFTVFPDVRAPLFTVGNFSEARKHSLAGYAEVSWTPTTRLTITAGGRYAYERQKTAFAPFPVTALVPDPRGGFHFSRFTPRVTARLALTATSNVYASYSQGFKSGFVNASDRINPPVRPEVVRGYEVGFKGRVGPLNLNLAAFWYDYTNLQVFVYNPPNGIFQNAASARIDGLEFDASIAPVAGLTISAGGTYLDGKYRSFPAAGVYLPAPVAAPGLPSFGNVFASVDASGNRLMRSPKFSANLSADYVVTATPGTFGAHVSGVYNSGVTYSPDERLRQTRYATIGGEISFIPAKFKDLRIVVYGKNLTKKLFIQSVLSTQFADGVAYSEPRTFGIRGEYSF